VSQTPGTSPREGPDDPTRLGVAVVEPLPVVRAGLVRVITTDPRFDVLLDVGHVDDALAGLERVGGPRIVALVAMGLSGDRDAYWLIRSIRERFPGHVILGVGSDADADIVSRALFVGADGFLDTSIELEEFLDGIRRAAEDEVVIAGPFAGSVGQIADGLDRRRAEPLRLTDRERQVLTVAAEGLTAREIAVRLGVRERTVTTHLARIYGKLGVGNRLAAVRVATRAGLVPMVPAD
jgi:DNA-binding NarL/FixJ family response regulator